jgi:hypothetical protein
LPVKTTQNANLAPLVSSQPQNKRSPQSSRSFPGYAPGVRGLFYGLLSSFGTVRLYSA